MTEGERELRAFYDILNQNNNRGVKTGARKRRTKERATGEKIFVWNFELLKLQQLINSLMNY